MKMNRAEIWSQRLRRVIVPLLCLAHIALHTGLALAGQLHFWDPFLILLIFASLTVAGLLFLGQGDPWVGLGFVLVVSGHGLVGHALAPTALTSAAMLMGNALTVYVGWKLFQNRWTTHGILFLCSYLVLYWLFIRHLSNTEPLFLLALLGLAGTARHLKLLAYFWSLVFAFTFGQPYAWETAVILVLTLKILFTIHTPSPSLTVRLFLGLGLVLLFCVLFPVAAMMMQENPFNLFNLLKDRDIWSAITLTLFTATCSTILLSLFSIPLSYALARLEFFGKPFLLSLIDIPIVIPQSVAGIALLKVFGKQQILGGFLFQAFGLRFDGTVLGIIAAQMFVALPFFMRSAMAAFEAVPPKYERAAQGLGANAFSAFWRIAMPLAGQGVFLGAVIAWARAAGEFGAVFFIAAYPETAPVAVYTRFMSMGLTETAPLVSALLLFSIIMFFMLQWIARMMPSITRTRS